MQGYYVEPDFLKVFTYEITQGNSVQALTKPNSVILTESSAMLVYIASKGAPKWLGGSNAVKSARIQQWLSFSHRLTAALGGARLHEMLLRPGDIRALHSAGNQALRELEAALTEQRLRGLAFLACSRPTVADIACFPYVALAPDGGISLDPYPSVRLWLRAIRALEHFIEMPGIHRLHELRPDPALSTQGV